MSEPNRDPESQALRRAARGFTRALAAQAVLRTTARIEAIVHAAQAEPVFLFEAALRSAWPHASGEAPSHELVWAKAGEGETRLHVHAFDREGRLLLARSYGAPLRAAVAP